ncbi:MAG: DUF2203 family protein [Deltaproteobacteria bacterium]|jgi:hypothetical protein|nr:DUF2203 family protein [Deltaproteobacteria bacterium]
MEHDNDIVFEPRRYYSISEANAIVPKLEYFFGKLGSVQRHVNNICRKANDYGINIDEDEFLDKLEKLDNPIIRHLKRRLDEHSEDYLYYLDRIESLGVVVEDADHGIVRMYSWLDDDEVYLSWQYGEMEVSFWHDVDEDYIARKPLFGKQYTPAEKYPIH